jgi:predicted lipoprotein with Yx(FWY)xxD motif
MKNNLMFSTLLVIALVASACSAAPTAMPATAMPATAMPATAMPATIAPVIPVTGATPTPAPTAMSVATPTITAVVAASQNASLGSFLVDANGMTLYVFTKDTAATGSNTAVSACTGGCATLWPPLLTNGAPSAGTGATASLLGTLTRPDGSVQVTYNGWPLYDYSLDKTAGDTNGQGFKGVWFALTPAGTQVTAALPAETAAMPAETAAPVATDETAPSGY